MRKRYNLVPGAFLFLNAFSLSFISLTDNTPELKKWIGCMSEDPAVKATTHSMEAHMAFYKSYIDGTPDYDYGL